MSDVSEVYFLPRLLSWLRTAAPHVTIESMPLRAGEIARRMKAGEIDLAIGHIPQLRDECASELLFNDRLICLVRSDHPQAGSVLTADAFARLRQIDVGDNAPSHSILEEPLARRGLKRSIVLNIHHLLAAPSLVRDTDLGVIFPESLATALNRNDEFSLLPLGFDIPEIEVRLHVHRQHARDEAVIWLMNHLKRLASRPGPDSQ